MRDVLVSLQVSVKDQAHTHRVSSRLCHVDGSSNRTSKLEFVCLDWHNLHQWKFLNQLFGTLVIQAVLLDVPSGTFQVQALHEGTVLESLGDVFGVALSSHDGVQSGFIQSPALASASRLHKSGQVGLGNVESGQPNDLRFLNFIPLVVLLVTAQEVLEPVDQVLQ